LRYPYFRIGLEQQAAASIPAASTQNNPLLRAWSAPEEKTRLAIGTERNE
jgi:hypothetical protein